MSNDANNEEEDFTTISERHHQIMDDGDKFFRNLAIGATAFVLFICFLIAAYLNM